MYVKEIWRYPVKSMAGERVSEIEAGETGLAGDRHVLVQGPHGRILTARTHPALLGLHGTLDAAGLARIDGHAWNSPEALALVRQAVGTKAGLIYYDEVERFDVLPLLVATDGAIAHLGIDGRRLRPNIIVGGVEGLAERDWPGRQFQIGGALIHTVQLRGRCVMTTYDPDTQQQDLSVLKRIARELDGTMALDSAVLSGGPIRQGDPVTLVA
jgi:uncharacterized protein